MDNHKSKLITNIGRLVSANTDGVTVVENTSVLIENGQITAIGEGDAEHKIDCGGKMVTAGFVDSHTHPVFFNKRDEEYAMRLAGSSYEEIAEKGGGIVSSVAGVRNASKNALVDKVSARMDRFISLGTTTVESKSGYGLDTASELKSLEVIDEVNESHAIDMVPTFMGGHAFPNEFVNDHDAYILETGKKYGLKPRLHADEFVDSGAAELAGEVSAFSADHLMAVSDAGINRLAENNVVASLLPGTTFFLGKTSYAPARQLLDAGLTVALATDFNPGSCHIQSMPFIMTLACMHMGMTVEEAYQSTTYHGAKALGLEHEIGSIDVGKKADLVVWNLDSLLDIPYHVSNHSIQKVIKNGNLVFGA